MFVEKLTDKELMQMGIAINGSLALRKSYKITIQKKKKLSNGDFSIVFDIHHDHKYTYKNTVEIVLNDYTAHSEELVHNVYGVKTFHEDNSVDLQKFLVKKFQNEYLEKLQVYFDKKINNEIEKVEQEQKRQLMKLKNTLETECQKKINKMKKYINNTELTK